MTTADKAKFLAIRTAGNFLLLLSLYGVGATFGPVLMYEVQFRISEARGIHYTVSEEVQANTATQVDKGGPGFADVLAGKKEQVLTPKDTDFSILIPKIGASAKVYPNVDPTNENEFLPILQEGVAHAKGTVFPGMNGNIYRFAQSTDNWWNVGRYNAVFYLIKELQPGDDVDVFFENRRYNYVVQGSEIKDPNDVSFLQNSRGDKEQLILQTCWPPGTTWKRLYVTAIPKSGQ
jgi:sortase A